MSIQLRTSVLAVLVGLGVAACGGGGGGGTKVASDNSLPKVLPNKTTVEEVEFVDQREANKVFRLIFLNSAPPTWDETVDVKLDSGYQAFAGLGDSIIVHDATKPLVLNLGAPLKNEYAVNALKDTKNYLGVHQGIVGPHQNLVTDNLRYLFVNQPYSSYGALFVEGSGSTLMSHVSLGAGPQDGYKAVYPVWTEGKDGLLQWNKEVKGDSVYQGQVIGSLNNQTPVLDGTVKLFLHLNEQPGQSHMRGEIDSKLVGKIYLGKGGILPETMRAYGTPSLTEKDPVHDIYSSNRYGVRFVGKNLNDAVGNVSVEEGLDGGYYNAVFGATKQK